MTNAADMADTNNTGDKTTYVLITPAVLDSMEQYTLCLDCNYAVQRTRFNDTLHCKRCASERLVACYVDTSSVSSTNANRHE